MKQRDNTINPLVDEEIDIFDVISHLWKDKILISIFGFGFGITGAIISFLMTTQYESTALLEPITPPHLTSTGSMGGTSLGGLGSLLNMTAGKIDDVEKYKAIITSRKFIEEFMKNFNLLPVLYSKDWDATSGKWLSDDPSDNPSYWKAYKPFVEDVLSINVIRPSGLISLTVTWEDPEVAKAWSNYIINKINNDARINAIDNAKKSIEYLNAELSKTTIIARQKVLYNLIERETQKVMFAETTPEYAFNVIDPPSYPELRSSPRRTLITILMGILGGMVGIFCSLVLNVWNKKKNRN